MIEPEAEDMPDVSALVNEVMEEDDASDPLLESYQHLGDSDPEPGGPRL
jgi:hypothetical protein